MVLACDGTKLLREQRSSTFKLYNAIVENNLPLIQRFSTIRPMSVSTKTFVLHFQNLYDIFDLKARAPKVRFDMRVQHNKAVQANVSHWVDENNLGNTVTVKDYELAASILFVEAPSEKTINGLVEAGIITIIHGNDLS